MNEDLLTVLAQVVEQMGFLTPTGPGGAPDDSAIIIGVTFSGPSTGLVRVAASRSLAEVLARNLLALDADAPVSMQDAGDAVRELANVVAGNALPVLCGDGEYSLSSPEEVAWSERGESASIECLEGLVVAGIERT
jgi:CheY-specific phosphatase CheX